ncbi:MAG: UDP-N-acetylglucosamine--N-acetylmuramyl-(pentapeptide) pyrophosphoryl-undecaprenol N-acetylglucosamine transferase, partial [Agrobacterium fabrum]
PADEIHVVPSATIGSKNPISVAGSLWKLWVGLRAARRLVAKLKPVAVVGFGGYPTVPPLLASTGLGVPSIIHEQNAVMGRANKALAGRVKAIAGGFLPPANGQYSDKTVATGNPVRPAVLAASEIPYTASQTGEPFQLVVFGGSQGAQFFSSAVPAAICLLKDEQRKRIVVTQQARPEDKSSAVPAAICLLKDEQRKRIVVTQQARPEDKDSVIASYQKLGVKADVSPFFGDMASRIGEADLVISRSGASTVSELSVIGRPSILVPYPHALDHDQAANAAALSAAGGASVIKQAELSPQKLSGLLSSALAEPERLSATAAAAKATGKPHAADVLADLVEAIASGRSVQEFKKNIEGVGA